MRFLTTLLVCLLCTVLATNMRAEDTALAARSFLGRLWDSVKSVFKGKPNATTPAAPPAPKPRRTPKPRKTMSEEELEDLRKIMIEDGFISK
jgi:hypothetical protein